MEVPVQLQTAAFVLVDGLDGHVKKVWTFFTYVVDHILSWHCPCLWIILLAVCMCGKFGRERKCSAMYLPCYCLRVFQLYISWEKAWMALFHSISSSHSVQKPSALRSARTEEPVHLQIPAVVLVGGLGALAVKVCRMHALVQDL